jgi:hypothetical protein
LREVDRLYDEAKRLYEAAEHLGENRGADPALAAANDKADGADLAMTELSERIFAALPITPHNLKLRAVLAKYWQEHNQHGEAWETPDDCDAREHTVMAQLIHGVLQIDTPPDRQHFEPVALPSPELAMFRSALAGAAEFRRANREPEVDSPGYMTPGTRRTASGWTAHGRSPRAFLRARRRRSTR